MQQPPAPPAQLPASTVPKEIPESFFLGLPDPAKLPRSHPESKANQATAPMRAMILYDAIIDDIFLYPTTKLGETAARLGKAASTISLVVRSDFFRARWLQRREQYNADLNFRLASKMAAVAEKSLDVTLEALNTRSNIPLPLLTEVNKTMLDRLGYGPAQTSTPTVAVQVNNTNAPGSLANSLQASPEGLAAARQYLQILEQRNAASGAKPGNTLQAADTPAGFGGPVVEGELATKEPADASST